MPHSPFCFHRAALVLATACLLAACGPQTTEPTVTQTGHTTPAIVTPPPTEMPTITAIPTVTPTPTLEPSATPEPNKLETLTHRLDVGPGLTLEKAGYSVDLNTQAVMYGGKEVFRLNEQGEAVLPMMQLVKGVDEYTFESQVGGETTVKAEQMTRNLVTKLHGKIEGVQLVSEVVDNYPILTISDEKGLPAYVWCEDRGGWYQVPKDLWNVWLTKEDWHDFSEWETFPSMEVMQVILKAWQNEAPNQANMASHPGIDIIQTGESAVVRADAVLQYLHPNLKYDFLLVGNTTKDLLIRTGAASPFAHGFRVAEVGSGALPVVAWMMKDSQGYFSIFSMAPMNEYRQEVVEDGTNLQNLNDERSWPEYWGRLVRNMPSNGQRTYYFTMNPTKGLEIRNQGNEKKFVRPNNAAFLTASEQWRSTYLDYILRGSTLAAPERTEFKGDLRLITSLRLYFIPVGVDGN